MKISTRGVYAVRFMVFLAKHNTKAPVSLKEVAHDTHISRKYLEQIASMLSTAGLVKSSRGASGGYRLAKQPSLVSVRDVLTVTEGSLAPVDYLDDLSEDPAPGEERYEVFVWQGLHKVINDYLSSISLQDILDRSHELDVDSYSI